MAAARDSVNPTPSSLAAQRDARARPKEMRTKVEACHRGSVRSASASRRSMSTRRFAFSGPAVGGIALFVGTVRNLTTEPASSRWTTPNTPALEVLTRRAEETADQHDVLAIAVEHRVGHLEVGDIAVVVAVGAVHRGEALAACAHLINTLKADANLEGAALRFWRLRVGRPAWRGRRDAG